MGKLQTATLDANAETFTLDVDASQRAFITMDFTSTATVTWTVAAFGGSVYIPLRKSDNSTAAAYTADDYLMVDGPVSLKATASGVSGGSCAIEARIGITN
jgi:hypothetical protein